MKKGGLEDTVLRLALTCFCPLFLQAAVAAGIKVIALTTGQSAEALHAAGASYVCENYDDILKMIKDQQ